MKRKKDVLDDGKFLNVLNSLNWFCKYLGIRFRRDHMYLLNRRERGEWDWEGAWQTSLLSRTLNVGFQDRAISAFLKYSTIFNSLDCPIKVIVLKSYLSTCHKFVNPTLLYKCLSFKFSIKLYLHFYILFINFSFKLII